jgi:hypothetical protein
MQVTELFYENYLRVRLTCLGVIPMFLRSLTWKNDSKLVIYNQKSQNQKTGLIHWYMNQS